MSNASHYPSIKNLLAVLTVVMLVAAGCGGEVNSSPTQPDLPGNFAAQGTSAVWGQLVGGGGGSATAASFGGTPVASAMGGVQVTIQGTNITTTTNGNGQFLLNGVPHGSVVLVFSGGGADANLTLNGVGKHQLVQIIIQVQANTASVVNQWVEELGEFNGQVDSVDPDADSFTLVDGTTIVTDSTTWWDDLAGDYGSFDDMATAFDSGTTIKAGGRVFTTEGGVLLATFVRANNAELSVEDFWLSFSRSKWSLGWIDNGNTGTGNSAIEASIKGGPFGDIDPSTVMLNGPVASVAPFATELEYDRFEARFTKSQVISVASESQPGDTVEVTVSGNLNDGTPWELTAVIEISDDDDDDDDDDGGGTLDPAAAEAARAKVKQALDYLVSLDGVGLVSGNIQPLKAKLEAAIASLDRFNGNSALGQLGAFLNQLGNYSKKGRIDGDAAAYLEQLVQEAIAIIRSG